MFISAIFRILSFRTLPFIPQKKSASIFPQITHWQLSAFRNPHSAKYPFPNYRPNGRLVSRRPPNYRCPRCLRRPRSLARPDIYISFSFLPLFRQLDDLDPLTHQVLTLNCCNAFPMAPSKLHSSPDPSRWCRSVLGPKCLYTFLFLYSWVIWMFADVSSQSSTDPTSLDTSKWCNTT